MQWHSLTDFLAMGGHGAFVWPAFAIAALVLAGLVAASRRQLRRAQLELAALEAAGGRRERRRALNQGA